MESVTLENGNEYVIIDEIVHNGNHYVYLTNINNKEDICIRKSVQKDDGEYFEGLKDESELQNALILFANKNTKGE